jgi:hypothetical protein
LEILKNKEQFIPIEEDEPYYDNEDRIRNKQEQEIEIEEDNFKEKISGKIVEGFNSDLDKMDELTLRTLLLSYKSFAYTKATQHMVICWNRWKIDQITDRLKDL